MSDQQITRGSISIDGVTFPTMADSHDLEGYRVVVVPFETGLFAYILFSTDDGDCSAELTTEWNPFESVGAWSFEEDPSTLCWTAPRITHQDMRQTLEEWSRWSVARATEWKKEALSQ